MTLKIQLVRKTSCLPEKRGKKHIYTLYCDANENTIDNFWCIHPKDILLIPSGIKIEIPEGYCAKLFTHPASEQNGMKIATGESIIDSDYRGEILVPIQNISNKTQYLGPEYFLCLMVIEKLTITAPYTCNIYLG